MNEWIKKQTESIKGFWAKWSIVQKAIFGGIILAAIIALVVMLRVSSAPSAEPVFNVVIDENVRDEMVVHLQNEGIKASVSADGKLVVPDSRTAQRARSSLLLAGLQPSTNNPYEIFNVSAWAKTDFHNEKEWKDAMERLVKRQVESLQDVRIAYVMLTAPEKTLFASEQEPVTAGVTVYAQPGSDILQSKKKIKSLVNLISKSVEGLKPENITIVDGTTSEAVNDFEGMEASERVDITAKEQKLVQKLEAQYSSRVFEALSSIFKNRINRVSVKIDMDMSKEQSQATIYSPIVFEEDNPDTPFNDSVKKDSLILSSETVTKSWQGTEYTPEGPGGTEGQTPAVYGDMQNVVGRMEETGVKQNNVVNRKDVQKEESPQIKAITVSVNIDGVWSKKYDEKGNVVINKNKKIEREYTPVSEEDLASAKDLVIKAVNSDKEHVSVTNIAVDHQEEFDAEDESYLRKENTRKTILYSLAGIAFLLLAFIIFRFINREIERRKRLREEEILRKQQAAREAALWEARDQGVEVQMSVEERKRTELQENAIAMAKEHPEDVAMLIRTWLMEE